MVSRRNVHAFLTNRSPATRLLIRPLKNILETHPKECPPGEQLMLASLPFPCPELWIQDP